MVLAVLALACAIAAAQATAKESPQRTEPSLSQREYQQAVADPSDRIGTPETDAEAGEGLPHRELEREGAEQLLSGVFGEVIESETTAPGEEDDIVNYDSNHVAVVEEPLEGRTSLVESLLPLRAEDEQGQTEPVDLELERQGRELTPQNPLVDVGMPSRLGEGIDLPGSEVEIRLQGAPEERAPSTIGGSTAFYPNVAPDTDLAVAPTATGVETLTQMRTAEAPSTETFELNLPAGASLQPDKEGGAEVVESGHTVVSVDAPSAMDADGEPVPVALSVNQDSIMLDVEPAKSVAYPILVDPVYETWFWELNHSTEGTSDWVAASNSGLFQPTAVGRYGEPGLNIYTVAGGPIAPGTQANWNYHVPRFYTDQQNPEVHEMPTSWIQSMTLTDLRWWFEESGPPFPADPSLVMGLWDEVYGGWSALGVRTGSEGQLFDQSFRYILQNPNENVHTKTGAVLLQSFEGQSHARHLLVGQAEVQVTDSDYPNFGLMGSPTSWVNNAPTSPIPYKVTDTGLGVNELSLWEPQIGGGSKNVLSWEPCFGNVSHPCPRTLTQGQLALSYDPSSMPQGEDWVDVAAQDPVHHWSYLAPGGAWAEAKVKVDHTAPELVLSGTLTEQATLGTHRPTYNLRVRAADGAEGAPQSGIATTEVQVDGKKIVMPEEAEWNPHCATRDCQVAAEWTLDASEFAPGRHEVKVIAKDAVNLSKVEAIWIELHQVVPSLSVTGTLTEQSRVGPERPRYTLQINDSARAESPAPASLPSYSAAFGSAGSGNGQFNHPGDVALDAKGDLWIVDSANSRVEEFNAKGEYLGKIGTAGTGNGQLSRPTAIAIDPSGHIWVADAQNNRIEEFSEAGAFLGRVGSAGAGNGQFAGSGPEGIAVDGNGDIWVSDTYGGRLEKFGGGGEFLGAVGAPGAGPKMLGEPTGLDVGPGGNVWVADWRSDKVVEYAPSGQFLREFGEAGAADGQFMHPDGLVVDSKGDVWVGDQNNERIQEFSQTGEFLGKFGTAGSGPGQLELGYPMGLAVDPTGDLWVTDAGNDRVEKWTPGSSSNGSQPSYVGSFGSAGSGAGQFSSVDGIALDAKGDVWAADIGANRIQEFSPSGELLASYGAAGTAGGQYNQPTGPAVNSGHVWIADVGNDRIQELSEAGGFLSQFGQAGSQNGPYFNVPVEVAVDSSHRLWVADAANNRVEEMTETGAFIRSVSSLGAAGSFNWPAGVSAGPGGRIWITDYGDHRIVELSETGAFLRQFGGSANELGVLSQPIGLAVDSHEDVWVADRARDRVIEFNGQGEYVGQFGNPGSGPGDLNQPEDVALDGDGHIFVSDTGNHRIDEWSIPAAHSQLSTEITIDGKRVASVPKTCESELCTESNTWSLESASLAPGSHEVEIQATDGLGNTASKRYMIQVHRDTIKPSLEVGGELASAPEGWVQQESYGLHAVARDPGGYGATSLVAKIDGGVVASVSENCPEGGCSAEIQKSLSMAAYAGGAHEAEVVATDGAGNTSVHKWTINVDPEGHISTAEAEATLEAFETTGGINTVGEAREEAGIPGTAPGLGIAERGAEDMATGSNVPTAIATNPTDGIEMEILEQGALYPACGASTSPDRGEPEVGEEGEKEAEACGAEQAESKAGLEPIEIVPTSSSGQAEQVVSSGETSTIAANVGESIDSVVRPLFDGAMQFQAIRDSSAPEQYSWQVMLEPEQELKLVDEHTAVVLWEGGPHVALHISAIEAADAIGSAVPTKLEVSDGDILTLTVSYRSGNYVFPIVAGTGWQGGFQTYQVQMPPPEVPPVNLEEEETYELEQLSSGDVIIGLSSFGAVDEEEVLTTDQKRDMALDVSARISDAGRPFRFDICHPHLIGSDPIPADGPDDHAFRKELTKALDFHCRDPESGGNYWRVTMGGRFHYVPHQRVWLNWKQWNCEKTGGSEIVDLLLIHCEAFYPDGENYPSGTRFKGPIAAMGEFRFAAGAGQWVAEARGACLSVGGWLYPNSRVSSEGYYEAPLEYQRPKYIIPGVEECPGISVRLESE